MQLHKILMRLYSVPYIITFGIQVPDFTQVWSAINYSGSYPMSDQHNVTHELLNISSIRVIVLSQLL